jgi:hypothetical protein
MIDLKDYSLVNLLGYLGDVGVVKAVCYIWNSKHAGDFVRIESASESEGYIIITGRCHNPHELLEICKYMTSIGAYVTYEKTDIAVEV